VGSTGLKVSGSVPGNPKGYINQRNDPSTGLLYLNARYLDPDLGLFTQPDTLDPLQPGVGTNRYAYAGGDPVNKADPGGKFFGLDDLAASGIGAAAGLIGQGVSDLWNGELSGFKAYGISAAAGAVADEVGYHASFVATPVGGAAAAGAAYSATEDALYGRVPSLEKAAISAALGGATAGVLRVGGKVASKFATNTTRITAAEQQKSHHIFGQGKHKMDPLVDRFGSQEQAYLKLDAAAKQAYRNGDLNLGANGINTGTRISVGGVEVDLVGGRVIDGKFVLGSASRRDVP
jgi:RHS repeat-associated protein